MIDRRALVVAASGLCSALFGAGGNAKAAPSQASTAALVAAGLDPLIVYRKMFAGMGDGSECCWWYAGSLPLQVEDVGEVCAFQEETLRAQRTQDRGPDAFNIRWREAGVFREFTTGEVPNIWFDPVTGEQSPHLSVLGGAPVDYVVSRKGDGIAVALLLPGATVQSVTVTAAIKGDRVSLTQVETKSRSMGGPVVNLRSTLKIYASLADLKSGAPSVAAKGFYSVYLPDAGKVFVAGMMQKASMTEKLNPIAWDRVKATSPAFFKGDRISPAWS